MRLVSVNTYNLYGSTDPAEQARYRQVENLIAGLDADVVAVQELIAHGPDKQSGAGAALERLAHAAGLHCTVDGRPVVAVGGGHHHVGLLWRTGLEPIAGSIDRFGRDPDGMWHSLVTAVVQIGDRRLRVGSVHLSPFDAGWRRRDAHQVLRALHGDTIPGVVGGDWNCVGADPSYDPDPYVGALWHPCHAYQLDDDGQVDRKAAARLERAGRMRDCAVVTGAPATATIGHHPDSHRPPRRIDRWYATHHLPDAAIIGYDTVDPAAVGACTDHLPVRVHLDLDALPTA